MLIADILVTAGFETSLVSDVTTYHDIRVKTEKHIFGRAEPGLAPLLAFQNLLR